MLTTLGLVVYSQPATALEVPAVPPLDKAVVDLSGTLTEQQVAALAEKINKSRLEKDYQIGILIIPTLGTEEYLEGYSLEVARAWGIGDKEKDNGILLLVAKNDRKLRIEVGRGLEGELTDVESGRIIRNVIAPKFKVNNYYGGLEAGVGSIQAQVEGRSDPALADGNSDASGIMEGILGLLPFVLFWFVPSFMWLMSVLARSKSWWLGGVLGAAMGGLLALLAGGALMALIAWGALTLFGFLFDFVISKNYRSHLKKGEDPSWWAGGTWIGGGGGFGGGSSGGGGFGGGGFGGGGASGDW